MLHYFYYWNFVKHFFQWSVGNFSKVEKGENSKFVNMHYTFFGMAWKISHLCKIILLNQSLNCMQQKFDLLIFYPWIFENQFERFQIFIKSQYWQFKKPNWTNMRLATGMDKAKKKVALLFLHLKLHHLFFSIIGGWFSKVEKVENSKYVNLH